MTDRHVFHFFLPAGEVGAPGALRRVTDQDARRIERVLRLRTGEPVEVADADGRVWTAVVGERGTVLIERELRAPRPAPPLVVRLALSGPRSDTAVEKLVELGVERISPLETEGSKREPRIDRWRRIAEAAACQSKRPRIPVVEAPAPLARVLTAGAVMLSNEQATGSLGDALRAVKRPVELLVGPEAGFRAEEHALALDAGVPIATLGDLVLRSETAAIAAAVLALEHLGALA